MSRRRRPRLTVLPPVPVTLNPLQLLIVTGELDPDTVAMYEDGVLTVRAGATVEDQVWAVSGAVRLVITGRSDILVPVAAQPPLVAVEAVR